MASGNPVQSDPKYGYDQQGDFDKRNTNPTPTNYGYDQQPPPYAQHWPSQQQQNVGQYPPQQNMGQYPPQQNMGQYPPPVSNNNVNVVVNQPAVATTFIVNVRPRDYLGLAIFTCLCCFCPLGLAAIVFSCNSQSESDRMDYAKALSSARTSRFLSIASVIVGAIAIIILIILASKGLLKYNTYDTYYYDG